MIALFLSSHPTTRGSRRNASLSTPTLPTELAIGGMTAEALQRARNAARAAYAEIDNPALSLAAYLARLSDPSLPLDDFSLRPVPIAVRTRRWIRFGLAFRCERRFSFPAQFLHRGAYRREVVGGARLVHVLLPLA